MIKQKFFDFCKLFAVYFVVFLPEQLAIIGFVLTIAGAWYLARIGPTKAVIMMSAAGLALMVACRFVCRWLNRPPSAKE